MKFFLYKVAFLLAFIPIAGVYGQTPQGDYEGFDFWAAFMPNNGSSTMTIIITSRFATTATITTPLIAGGMNTTVAIPANGVTQVNIPATVGGVDMTNSVLNTNLNAGIRITSPAPISVFGANVMTASSDTWLNIPANKLGNDYVSIGFTGYSATSSLPSQILVMATDPGTTTINVTVPVGKSVQGQGSSFSVTLNQGQTYLIQAPMGISDAVELTGLRLTSVKNFAAYGGAKCTGYPETGNRGGYASCGPCDHMVEMITPLSTWGGTYVLALFDLTGSDAAASGNMDSKGNFMRIVSGDALPVTITVSGAAPITLNGGVGDYMDRQFTTHTVVTANRKIMVYQIMGATTCYFAIPSSGVGDPCFTNIAPAEQWGKKYAFATPNGATGFTHYINIVKKSNAGLVSLDGVNQTGFTNIAGTPYYVKNATTVSAGVHNLAGDSAFIVYSYGVEVAGSYCNQVSGSNLQLVTVPVDFLSFSASPVNNTYMHLDWAVAHETNVKEYIIERLKGGDFVKVGTVSAKGNSSIKLHYTFDDFNSSTGTSYYRVKEVDFDGTGIYSSTTKAFLRSTQLSLIGKQPVTDIAEFSLEQTTGKVAITVYDQTGRIVLENSQQISEESQIVKVDVSSLKGGLYFLQVETPEYKQSAKLLID